jgi:DNA-directed RNA polymerase subunit RPC12/RpoP
MSMTREEAIKYAESKKMRLEALVYSDDCKYGNYAMYSGELSFVNAALSALRPVGREQVEKVWRGGWIAVREAVGGYKCSRCKAEAVLDCNDEFVLDNFCPWCGAPMTDEAVQMVMERLEALHDTGN